MKKIIALIFCFITVFSMFSFSASAAEDNDSIVQARLSYISSPYVKVSMSNSVFSFSASMSSSSSSVSSVNITAYVQRRVTGSSASWTVIRVYTASGTSSCSLSNSIDCNSGYEYRLYAMYTAEVTDGSSETTYRYSSVKTCS